MIRNRIKVIKKKKGKGLFPETKVQLAIVKYIKLKYPHAAKFIIKIDNEGKRTVQGHELAKRCGLHIGASDLFIAKPTLEYYGLWLEIKKDGWKMVPSNQKHTEKQLSFIDRMNSVGYKADIGVGIDECMKIVDEYFKPTHPKS